MVAANSPPVTDSVIWEEVCCHETPPPLSNKRGAQTPSS